MIKLLLVLSFLLGMALWLACDKAPNGGKACALTPAGGSLVRPTCFYSCPNGTTFSTPGPLCSITSPYPKK